MSICITIYATVAEWLLIWRIRHIVLRIGIMGARKIPDETVSCTNGITSMKARNFNTPVPFSAFEKPLKPAMNIPPTLSFCPLLEHEKLAARAVSSTNENAAVKNSIAIKASIVTGWRR